MASTLQDKYDIIIIGRGLAAWAAAAMLAPHQSVLCVGHEYASSVHNSGLIHVHMPTSASYLSTSPQKRFKNRLDVFEHSAQTSRGLNKHHACSRFQEKHSLLKGIECIDNILAQWNVFPPSQQSMWIVPTTYGTLSAAPWSSYSSQCDIRSIPIHSKVMIVGFRELAHFSAARCAEMLTWCAQKIGHPLQCVPLELSLSSSLLKNTPELKFEHTAALAKYVSNEQQITSLAQAIQQTLHASPPQQDAQAFFIPPVIADTMLHTTLWKTFQSQFNIPCAELIASHMPSPAGKRMWQHAQHYALSLGVHDAIADISPIHSRAHSPHAVTLQRPNEDLLSIQASHIILATGRFASRALLVEPALQHKLVPALPLYTANQNIALQSTSHVVDSQSLQALLSIGLNVDHSQRVVHAESDHLYAIGHAVADTTSEDGLGPALFDACNIAMTLENI